MAPLVRIGGSRHTGQAAPPQRNIQPVIAEDLGTEGYKSPMTKNTPARGGYVMSPNATSVDTLLSRSKALADQERKEVD